MFVHAPTAPRGGIAHILPFAGIGGTEIQTLRLAEMSRSLGFSNAIYFPENASNVAGLFAASGFDTVPYTQAQPSYRHPLPYWRSSWTLAQNFRQRSIGLVHCSDILGAHYAGLGARLARAKLICHVRNSHTAISKRDQTFIYPVQQFVFVSKGVQQALSLPVHWKKGTVLYDVPGEYREITVCPAEARQRFGLSPQGPVVGIAARLSPQKNFPTLIRAARIVREPVPDVQFLIAGDIGGSEISRKY